jgi:hypothetical protein
MWSRNTLPEANSGHSSDKRIGGKFGAYGRDDRCRILVIKPEGKGPV